MNDLIKDKTPEKPRAWATPATDIFESDENFLLIAEVPGATREKISLAFDEGELKLEAALSDFDYKRAFKVGPQVDAEKISAHLENGALTITLPKLDKARPRQIPVA